MNILLWLVFGALAGWLASIIMGTDARMGAWSNILFGIVGSVVGGFVASLIGLGGVSGFNVSSLLIAVAGACLCLFVVNMMGRVRGLGEKSKTCGGRVSAARSFCALIGEMIRSYNQGLKSVSFNAATRQAR